MITTTWSDASGADTPAEGAVKDNAAFAGIRIDQLEVSYGPIRALQGVSLEIRTGETIALIGANAAGKSTLLNTIAGLVTPKRGTIVIEPNGDITRMRTHERVVRLGVILVPEGRGLLSRMTVGENLAMGERVGKKRSVAGEVKDGLKLSDIFEVFPALKERRSLQAGHLSGGEQQMLAIARALLMDPDILLIDEPSVGLAPILVAQMFSSLMSVLATRHATVLLAEQNTEIALELSDRAYVLERGQVVLSGTADEVARDPRLRVAYLSD